MKIELGKTKIRGFKFNHLTEGVAWVKYMWNYIGEEATITSIHHESFYQSMRVKFNDGNSYAYPLEMAKQYILNKETTSENDAVDSILYSIGVPYSKLFIDFNPKGCGIIEEITTKINNRNNMKNLKITAPEGYEIDKVNSTFENIVFKPIKKELPKSWEELESIGGGFQSMAGGVTSIDGVKTVDVNKNVFATKEQAEASIALAQLSQLREVYRDGWEPDYINKQYDKYTILPTNNKLDVCKSCNLNHFLSFQSEEVRDLFLENFRDLIEQAKPLMS